MHIWKCISHHPHHLWIQHQKAEIGQPHPFASKEQAVEKVSPRNKLISLERKYNSKYREIAEGNIPDNRRKAKKCKLNIYFIIAYPLFHTIPYTERSSLKAHHEFLLPGSVHPADTVSCPRRRLLKVCEL